MVTRFDRYYMHNHMRLIVFQKVIRLLLFEYSRRCTLKINAETETNRQTIAYIWTWREINSQGAFCQPQTSDSYLCLVLFPKAVILWALWPIFDHPFRSGNRGSGKCHLPELLSSNSFLYLMFSKRSNAAAALYYFCTSLSLSIFWSVSWRLSFRTEHVI